MTVLIAVLAACGLFLIFWTVVDALRPSLREGSLLVVFLFGDAAQVEQRIRSCRWLRERRGLESHVLFVDCDLEAEALQVAQLLLRDDDTVSLCKGEDLAEIIRLESTRVGAGSDQRHYSRSSISES